MTKVFVVLRCEVDDLHTHDSVDSIWVSEAEAKAFVASKRAVIDARVDACNGCGNWAGDDKPKVQPTCAGCPNDDWESYLSWVVEPRTLQGGTA
jgi:hypothetical protein